MCTVAATHLELAPLRENRFVRPDNEPLAYNGPPEGTTASIMDRSRAYAQRLLCEPPAIRTLLQIKSNATATTTVTSTKNATERTFENGVRQRPQRQITVPQRCRDGAEETAVPSTSGLQAAAGVKLIAKRPLTTDWIFI